MESRKKKTRRVPSQFEHAFDEPAGVVERLAIQPLNKKRMTVRIVGDELSALICNRKSSVAAQLRKKKLKEGPTLRMKADPEAEAEATLYKLSDGRYGFPCTGIKKSMFTAAHKDIGIVKSLVSSGVFIVADEVVDGLPLVAIESPSGPKTREDVVMVGSGLRKSADLRWRKQFEAWSILLHIEYDADKVTPETIVNLLERAGFGIGIGDWRPEKLGDHGRFHVQRERSSS